MQGDLGRTYEWLLKWDGWVYLVLSRCEEATYMICSCRYPVEEATWEGEDSMGDPQKLIEDFHVAAREEGFKDDDLLSTILLEEAVEAGWKEQIEGTNS